MTCLFAFCAAIAGACFFGENALLLRLFVEVSPGHRTLPLHPGFTGAKCVLKTFVARVQTFVVGVSFVYGRFNVCGNFGLLVWFWAARLSVKS